MASCGRHGTSLSQGALLVDSAPPWPGWVCHGDGAPGVTHVTLNVMVMIQIMMVDVHVSYGLGMHTFLSIVMLGRCSSWSTLLLMI